MRHCNGLRTPKATGRKAGKAGARFEARSQDIALTVLVGSRESGPLLRQEKDEARAVPRVRTAGRGMKPSFPVWRGLKAFLLRPSNPALVSRSQPAAVGLRWICRKTRPCPVRFRPLRYLLPASCAQPSLPRPSASSKPSPPIPPTGAGSRRDRQTCSLGMAPSGRFTPRGIRGRETSITPARSAWN